MSRDRDEAGRFVAAVACGRRNCTVCGRWRPVLDFGVHRWADEARTVPLHLKPECRPCRARLERERQKSQEYLARGLERSRMYHEAKRREEGRPVMGDEEYAKRYGPRSTGTGDELRVATESFRPYWEDILRLTRRRFQSHAKMPDDPFARVGNGSFEGWFDTEAFCVWAGIGQNEYELIRKTMVDDTRLTLPFELVDRVMVAAGMEYLVTSLYVRTTEQIKQDAARARPRPKPTKPESKPVPDLIGDYRRRRGDGRLANGARAVLDGSTQRARAAKAAA